MKEFGVDILGQTYTVKCGDRRECNLALEVEGQCYIYQKRIHVNTVNDHEPDETDEERQARIKDSVAHEVFHAFCAETGIYLPNDIEEHLATFFGTQWEKMNLAVTQILERMGDEL